MTTMKFIRNLRPVRFLLAALVSILLFSTPAYAAKSNPTKGTVQLDEITAESEKTAESPPMSLEEVTKRSNEGLNEVQGAADKSKMKRSDSSRPAVVGEVKKALDRKLSN
ncbi:MAG: hypothetical protein KME35_09905 [Aphanocapsa sp. GSE-SYN-MK-11-07L]|jgi:hypothetical protein|nr:hypothetical protein [Aphanocapsa sp. GSE-SYN-MK-11-07L]